MIVTIKVGSINYHRNVILKVWGVTNSLRLPRFPRESNAIFSFSFGAYCQHLWSHSPLCSLIC